MSTNQLLGLVLEYAHRTHEFSEALQRLIGPALRERESGLDVDAFAELAKRVAVLESRIVSPVMIRIPIDDLPPAARASVMSQLGLPSDVIASEMVHEACDCAECVAMRASGAS